MAEGIKISQKFDSEPHYSGVLYPGAEGLGVGILSVEPPIETLDLIYANQESGCIGGMEAIDDGTLLFIDLRIEEAARPPFTASDVIEDATLVMGALYAAHPMSKDAKLAAIARNLR